MRNSLKYISLISVNVLYACVMVFTRMAAEWPFMSWRYCLWLSVAVGIMAIYAICWQQILRRVELSTAYMFKGTSLIFVMLLAFIIFGETITWANIIGAAVIIIGIILFAKE